MTTTSLNASYRTTLLTQVPNKTGTLLRKIPKFANPESPRLCALGAGNCKALGSVDS